jgi:hypothetical protein
MLLRITNQKLNDLPKIIHQNCDALRLNKKLHGNQFGTLLKKNWYHETIVTSPHARESEIDWFRRWIDELWWFSKNEPFDEVQSVQSLKMNILDEGKFDQEISITLVFNIHAFITSVFFVKVWVTKPTIILIGLIVFCLHT